MTDGTSYAGTIFIDGTYEGDLMAAAGCTMYVGLEAGGAAGSANPSPYSAASTIAGTTWTVNTAGEGLAGYDPPVSATGTGAALTTTGLTIFEGNTNTLLPGYSPNQGFAAASQAAWPNVIMAYGFRLCVTTDPSKMAPWPKPAGYEAGLWTYRFQISSQSRSSGSKPAWTNTANAKADLNYDSQCNDVWNWPNGVPGPSAGNPNSRGLYTDSRTIYSIYNAMLQEQMGFFYWCANDPTSPCRANYNQIGLAADEFTDNQNWPREPYVRVGRRPTKPVFVFTQSDGMASTISGAQTQKTDAIAVGCYSFDSHRIIGEEWPAGQVGTANTFSYKTIGSYGGAGPAGTIYSHLTNSTGFSIPLRSLCLTEVPNLMTVPSPRHWRHDRRAPRDRRHPRGSCRRGFSPSARLSARPACAGALPGRAAWTFRWRAPGAGRAAKTLRACPRRVPDPA